MMYSAPGIRVTIQHPQDAAVTNEKISPHEFCLFQGRDGPLNFPEERIDPAPPAARTTQAITALSGNPGKTTSRKVTANGKESTEWTMDSRPSPGRRSQRDRGRRRIRGIPKRAQLIRIASGGSNRTTSGANGIAAMQPAARMTIRPTRDSNRVPPQSSRFE